MTTKASVNTSVTSKKVSKPGAEHVVPKTLQQYLDSFYIGVEYRGYEIRVSQVAGNTSSPDTHAEIVRILDLRLKVDDKEIHRFHGFHSAKSGLMKAKKFVDDYEAAIQSFGATAPKT